MNLEPWFKQMLNSWNVLLWCYITYYHILSHIITYYHILSHKNFKRSGRWVSRIPFHDFVSFCTHSYWSWKYLWRGVDRSVTADSWAKWWPATSRIACIASRCGTFRTAVWNIKHRIYVYAQSLEDFFPSKTNNFLNFLWNFDEFPWLGSSEILDLKLWRRRMFFQPPHRRSLTYLGSVIHIRRFFSLKVKEL